MKLVIMSLLVMSAVSQANEVDLYVGGYLGATSITGKNQEADKSGSQLGVKALGSWDMNSNNWVLDAGAGYHVQEVTGGGFKIETKTMTLESDLRYKLSSGWQVGAGLKSEIGTDNSGSETKGSDYQTTHAFAKLVKQTSMGSNPMRYELGVGTSLGTRSQLTVVAGVQFGLDWFSSKPTKAKNQVKEVKYVSANSEVADLKINLRMAKIHFDVDKWALDKETEAKLAKLAKFLAANDSEWSRVKISGHTDVTGDAKYNQALSQDRADTVLKVFVVNGMSESKVSAHGYGSIRPVAEGTSSEAFQKNRRTEIEFFGVKNREAFNKAISEILK